MNSLTDPQLLRDYTERRSEAAFAELVRRHVDLVYSAATRMVRDSHLAEDVTQGVFVALAQNARPLAEHPVLSGWLHRTTQNIAANIVRTDVRRRVREQEAVAMNELLAAEPEARWDNIAPQLDAALGELTEPDRDAVWLRYFERKSAREMAQLLGVSEEAAQKRVSRAVEHLRELFAQRGVKVGAGGLAVVISANAVQAAPVGLAVIVSTAVLAGTAVSTSAVIAATKTIAMTTLQKTLIFATLAVFVGAGIYEARQAVQLREQNQRLRQQQVPLAGQVQELRDEKNNAANRLAALADELEQAKGNSSELLKLRAEVTRLRKEADAVTAEAKDAKHFQSEALQVLSNTPPIRTFVSTVFATVSWGQTIVSGGWKTPSGRRVIVLSTVYSTDDANTQVGIYSRVVEYTEAAGAKVGLSQYNSDGPTAGKSHTLTSEQTAALLQAARGAEGIDETAANEVTTLSGRQAQVQTGDMHQTPSGEKYSTGPVIDFIPTISSDGQSVQVVMVPQLTYLIPTPRK